MPHRPVAAAQCGREGRGFRGPTRRASGRDMRTARDCRSSKGATKPQSGHQTGGRAWRNPALLFNSMPRFSTAKPLETSPRGRLTSRKKMACEGPGACPTNEFFLKDGGVLSGSLAEEKRKAAGFVFARACTAPLRKKTCAKGRCRVIETVRKEGTGTKRS